MIRQLVFERSPPRTRRAAGFVVAGLFALHGGAFPVDAQEVPTARIEGQVVESGLNRPIAGAIVRLEGDDRASRTDEDGRFTFDAVPLGRHVLSIDHFPHQPVRDSIRVEEEAATYVVRIELSEEPIELPPMLVTVRGPGTVLTDVHDRAQRMRRLGLGDQFDRRAIEMSGATRVSHLVARLPGVRLTPIPGRLSASELRLHSRNDCPPSIYVDGRQVRTFGATLDDFVSLPDLEFLEVYRRLSSLPLEFADEQAQSCGAVAAWTRRGNDADEPFGWRRMMTATGFVALSYIVLRLWF